MKEIKNRKRKYIISNEGREFMDRTNGMRKEGTVKDLEHVLKIDGGILMSRNSEIEEFWPTREQKIKGRELKGSRENLIV